MLPENTWCFNVSSDKSNALTTLSHLEGTTLHHENITKTICINIDGTARRSYVITTKNIATNYI